MSYNSMSMRELRLAVLSERNSHDNGPALAELRRRVHALCERKTR
jgi:hypothetical protein